MVNKKLKIRKSIGIVLLFIGVMSISSVREPITERICRFGEECIETTKYILNIDKLVVMILLIVFGLFLWLYPKEIMKKRK